MIPLHDTKKYVSNYIMHLFVNEAKNESMPLYSCCVKNIISEIGQGFSENDIELFEYCLRYLMRKKKIEISQRKSKYNSRQYRLNPELFNQYRNEFKQRVKK